MMRHWIMDVRGVELDVEADVYRAYDGELEVDIGGVKLKGNKLDIYEIVGGDVLDEIAERIRDGETEEARKYFEADQKEADKATG